MTPDLELFDYLFSKCLEITQETYDYLPAENDPSYSYSFIHVGNVTENGVMTKTSHSASFSIVIDVWGTREQRREVASLDDQQKQIMIDNSVANTVYVRGMVTLRFYLEEEK